MPERIHHSHSEGSSIMTSMTKQDTIEPELIVKHFNTSVTQLLSCIAS